MTIFQFRADYLCFRAVRVKRTNQILVQLRSCRILLKELISVTESKFKKHPFYSDSSLHGKYEISSFELRYSFLHHFRDQFDQLERDRVKTRFSLARPCKSFLTMLLRLSYAMIGFNLSIFQAKKFKDICAQ